MRGLRGKLTFTYIVVTVLALLAMELLAIGGWLYLIGLGNNDPQDYLADVIAVLTTRARPYLDPAEPDAPGLQDWLNGVYAQGYASGAPSFWGDSPAAPLVRSDAIFALSPDGVVLAQAPLGENDLVGRVYTPPDDVPDSAVVLARAFDGLVDPFQNAARTPQGDHWMAFPVLASDSAAPEVIGVLVVTVQPLPPPVRVAWPLLIGWVGATGLLFLILVIPIAALFGFIMARGLTRRLRALTAAADAWGEGNFQTVPQDRSRDEIGELSARLRHMAERIQDLLKTQRALALVQERNRLARELHDTVKQQNFATLMQVRAARAMLEDESFSADSAEPARAALLAAEELIQSSQQELKGLIAELRPAALDEYGLSGAMRRYVEEWSANTRIPVEVAVQNERALPLEVEQTLYRVLQEALANVARHSRASEVKVRLRFDPDQVRLGIADNGIGADFSSDAPAGYGVRGMRERLAAHAGTLQITSAPNQGVRLVASIPTPSPIAG